MNQRLRKYSHSATAVVWLSVEAAVLPAAEGTASQLEAVLQLEKKKVVDELRVAVMEVDE